MQSIIPVGTSVVYYIGANSKASIYDKIDRSDLTIMKIEEDKKLKGVVVGMFPLGMIEWAFNESTKEAFSGFIEFMQSAAPDRWQRAIMYIIRDRESRYTIISSSNVNIDMEMYN